MNKFIIVILFASSIWACNRSQNANKQTENHEMRHDGDSASNTMMAAMNQSMEGMHEAKQTGNPDYDFAAMMIPHHQGAVAMAKALTKETKDSELLNFGNQVITAQQQEISEMKDYLKQASTKPIAAQAKFKSGMQHAMTAMMSGMKHDEMGSIDKDFVTLMIPHHQSVVEMAKAYLPFAQNAQIKKIAEDVVSSQEKEIVWLKEKLEKMK